MKALRDFVYTMNGALVLEVLESFDLKLPAKSGEVALLRFVVLTPDSFIWRLKIGEYIFYLYAEDYVPGLRHVESVLAQYLPNNKLKLISVKKPLVFEQSAPVTSAKAYVADKDADSMMAYAAESGTDFVFLAQSEEDADGAFFTDELAQN